MINVEGSRFRLENDLFARELAVDAGGLRTVSIFNKQSRREYEQRPGAADFQVLLNNQLVTSFSQPEVHILDGNLVDPEQLLEFEDYQVKKGERDSEILELNFLCASQHTRIKVFFQLYPDLPGCVKWLEFECLQAELHISSLFFEQLNACPGKFVDADFFIKQGTVMAPPNFAACGDEDIIQAHNPKLNAGMFVGNGAPGPLRHYMVYPHWPTGISCGYNMSNASFNKFLQAGESFTTDKAYLYLYEGAQDDTVNRNGFREMVRRSLPSCPDNGGVMYCTWLPFLKNINEELLFDLADRAAALGFTWFVVDDGWFTNANWEVDAEKFPNGIEAISERVRTNGMKFGLWYNIGNDYGAPGSRPEDNALDANGNPKIFGFSGDYTCRCMASKHREFIIDKLSQLATQYRVDYFKLDFSSILSPYGMMPYGCSAQTHKYHRGAADAIPEQYAAMMRFREELKKQFPDLVIDFSFETFGAEAPSIGALRFSELHHVSNMSTTKPDMLDARKIRNTLYNYSALLPNERILGSLICLQNSNDVEHLLTAFTGTPLVAGDLRLIAGENLIEIKSICAALNELIKNGPLSEFHKFKGDRHISHDQWDGFARYAPGGRGIICLFRNESAGKDVEISIPALPEGEYRLNDMVNGKDVGIYNAADLAAGITVPWHNANCRALTFAIKK